MAPSILVEATFQDHDVSPFFKYTKWHLLRKQFSEEEILSIMRPEEDDDAILIETCSKYFLKICEDIDKTEFDEYFLVSCFSCFLVFLFFLVLNSQN